MDWTDDLRLAIDFESYPEAVAAMLTEVLAIEATGDAEPAGQFIDRSATWDEERHGVLAERIREAAKYRYRLVRYGALGE